jgi:hypothetical protein
MTGPVSRWCICAMLALCPPALAASSPATQPGPGAGMDYGPFLAYSISQPPGPKSKKTPPRVGIADKGLMIDVGNGATVCFDEDTCRMAAAWTGGFVDLTRTHQMSLKGWWDATLAGPIVFSTTNGPGWAKDGSFADPRPLHFGPLPKDWAHYKGLHRHGKQVVLSYSVGGVDVLELPGSAKFGGHLAFTRTIRVAKSDTALTLNVCDIPSGGRAQGLVAVIGLEGEAHSVVVQLPKDSGVLSISSTTLPYKAAFNASDGTTVKLRLPPLEAPTTFQLLLDETHGGDQKEDFARPEEVGRIPDLQSLCKGGPSLWNPPIETKGRLAPASSNKPYVVDTLTLPDDNPWHSWMRPTGVDFLPDGRCVICTLGGDVWIVSGVDKDLQHLNWKRFATGLYEPLGLKVVDAQIYVLCRDQITRLHDLDGDGEADFYENFNNDVPTYPAYHAFHFDLQADSRGNFWFLTDGNGVPTNIPMYASVIKVAYDGSKAEVVATGLRAANGGGMGPNDQFVCGDNQGNWTPVCRINWVKPGGFYGFNNTPNIATKEDIAKERKSYDVPLCWIPYDKDNSTGSQVLVTGGKWGPLEGRLLSTSYGKARLFECVWEESEGFIQGGTVELPLNFESGIMRLRFNPADGQLYVCGMKGWETNASRDGCLQRVRYTGKQLCLPADLHIQKDAIAITFTCPLDPKTANDEQSFGIDQYNYRWTGKYGSEKYKVSNPNQIGSDEVEVKSARLQPDGKTVILAVPGLRPVMQMSIQIHLNALDGTAIECELDNTINHVPGSPLAPVLSSP